MPPPNIKAALAAGRSYDNDLTPPDGNPEKRLTIEAGHPCLESLGIIRGTDSFSSVKVVAR